MSFEDQETWLTRILGPVDRALEPDFEIPFLELEKDAARLAQRETFLQEQAADILEANKANIKATLQGLTLKGESTRGRLRPNKKIKTEILADFGDGRTPIGIEQEEWDSWAEVASTLKKIGRDGNMVDLGSDEAIAFIQDISRKMQPLIELSQQMENMKDPDENYLFSARDIEKELWAPLVREGIIPSNLVPKKYSETVRVFHEGAAVYTELMAREDGTEMGGPKGIDKALEYAKDTVNFGKVIGTEILRYDSLSIVEASRKDLASFLQNKNPMPANTPEVAQLGGASDGETGTTSGLAITNDRFMTQMDEPDCETNYAAWLDAEESRLSGLSPAAGSDEAEQLEAIQAAKLTQEYGEYTRKQAMLNCAAAFAGSSIEAAQRARDRKRAKRDVAEALAEGLLDGLMHRNTTQESAHDLTTNADTQTRQHQIKFAVLATKAGTRALNNLSKAAFPPDSMDEVDRRELLINALSDVLDGIGEGISATGEKTVNDDGTISDNRFDRASIGLVFKGSAAGVLALDQMVAAAQKGDWAQVMTVFLTAGGGAVTTAFAGQIGDLTRADRDLDELEAGADGKGNGPWATNPFEEVRGAAGQTGFGMNGDMATMADQRALVSEARELLDQIDSESYADEKSKVRKTFERCRQLAAANPSLADEHEEVRRWLDPAEGQEPTAQDAQAALDRIIEVLDNTPMDAADEGERQDDAIIDRLEVNADKDRLKANVGDLREMIDQMRDADGEAPSEDALYAKFEEIRDVMLQDEHVLADIRSEMEEEDAWLDELKAEADLTRLETLTGEERAKERQKAIRAIELLTAELKKTEMKLNMLDQASKGAVGIALACVPGAAVLGKIRDLVADIAKLTRRAKELRLWARQMEAMRGNYSAYEYAAVGHHDVMGVAVTHDSLTVAADVAGVAAETLRLADHTHITAAVLTSIEKIGKSLNEFWFRKYSESKVASGWKMFKKARRNPENRRLARAAIRENTTFAKCVLAYGACVDKDNQAQAAVRACGLTPEVFEDGMDTCQAVVQYLLARLHDDEFRTIAAHDADAEWLPCTAEPTTMAWGLIKASACQLDPAMDRKYFNTHEIDALMDRLAAMPADDDPYETAIELHKKLDRYRPLTTERQQHLQMIIVAQDIAEQVERKWIRGQQPATA